MAKMNNNEMEKKLAEYLDERWYIAINSEPERQAIDRSYYIQWCLCSSCTNRWLGT